jgi:hypothetical protein
MSPYSPFLYEGKTWVIGDGPATAHWRREPNVIALLVDLEGPEHQIMRQLEFRIQRERKNRRIGLKKVQRRIRHHFDMYPSYLRAFDKKPNETNSDIAAEIFKALSLSDPGKRISEYRNKAKRLVALAQKGNW